MASTPGPKARARSDGRAPKVKKAFGKARRRLISLLFNRSPKDATSGSTHAASDWLESVVADLDGGVVGKVH